MKELSTTNRRNFIKKSAIGALSTITLPAFLSGCSHPASEKKSTVDLPEMLPTAPDGKPLRAGLIGCGGRGTGACNDFLAAGNGLQIVAIADIFEDKLSACRQHLTENKGQILADDHCFLGFDAYQKLIDLPDVDIVLLCTPPVFRPMQFDYAVEKNKHCFVEKPAAVDPVGARAMLVSGKKASAKNLCVISGTIRRSQRDCLETYRRVAEGAIGEIVSAHTIRNGSSLWHKKRQPGWNDMEYMMRNWVNFCWTSGDLVAEQFVHEIDLMTWFMGEKKPIKATACGGRQRRVTGDMYDFFSIEYTYDTGIKSNCTTRQMSGCTNEHAVIVYGTKGYTDCRGKIYNLDGSLQWEYPYPKPEDPDQSMAVRNPFEQEHIRLITAIRTGKPINDIEAHVHSTLMAIMGRMSAYTGNAVSWEEVMASTLKLGPDTYAFGPVPGIPETPPIPGIAIE